MREWNKPDHDSLFSTVDGIKLHYKRIGKGPIALLLHGSGSSLHCFDSVANTLSENYLETIRIDLPGFGLTGARPDRDYYIEAYSSTIARFMETLNIPRYAVVGNSLGGNIAWNLALDYPQHIEAIVLINATGYPEKSLPKGLRMARNPFLRPILRRWTPRSAVERNLRSIVGAESNIVTDEMIERVFQLMSLPGNRSAFIDFANTDQTDRSSQIANISIPTLVLRSAKIDGQHFARDIRNCQELVHIGGGHLLPEEDPSWVSKAIERFLHTVKKKSKE
ncbi:alpha/beta fold hydrolase [Leptospira andrefontaineae]|uniref:Alpha/beta hydrolase n=1 Tax=Leptospira andrefontaineae TaxID=2484976 RepID=A0A4R9GXK2_9LEPT|nr:alpha/beta hydrolase [Leptospira andrefontaineae]TGK36651.1 alpha/beta hydrolase [Leptospira andrefontaineae]